VNISSWLNFGCPALPGRRSATGRNILAPPYYSQCAVFASPLSAFSFVLVLLSVPAKWLARETPLRTSIGVKEIIFTKPGRRAFVFLVQFIVLLICLPPALHNIFHTPMVCVCWNTNQPINLLLCLAFNYRREADAQSRSEAMLSSDCRLARIQLTSSWTRPYLDVCMQALRGLPIRPFPPIPNLGWCLLFQAAVSSRFCILTDDCIVHFSEQ